MYKNYRSKNFLNDGRLLEKLDDHTYLCLACIPCRISDGSFKYYLKQLYINIDSKDINKELIEAIYDINKKENPEYFALACVEYYGMYEFDSRKIKDSLLTKDEVNECLNKFNTCNDFVLDDVKKRDN